ETERERDLGRDSAVERDQLVVVRDRVRRRRQNDPVEAEAGRLERKVERLGRAERVAAAEDRDATRHLLLRNREEVLPLVGLRREPLSARAGDHDAVDALADDPLDELGPAVEVERAAGVEGRRHRRDIAAPADALTVHAQSALTSIASVPSAS